MAHGRSAWWEASAMETQPSGLSYTDRWGGSCYPHTSVSNMFPVLFFFFFGQHFSLPAPHASQLMLAMPLRHSMQFCCMKMALFGPFRDISTRGFAPNARRAEKIYLESAEQLAQLLYQHQKSFTLRLGACGIVLFASLAASGLLDALEFQTRAATAKPSSQRSEQQSQNQARRGELLHVAVKLMAAAGLRFRLGRGMLHVVAERVEKLAQRSPFTGRIAVLPQTCRLLRDFEEHVWCYESPEYYSSIMPEYSSATRELLKNKGSGPHQLTAMLSKLAVREE